MKPDALNVHPDPARVLTNAVLAAAGLLALRNRRLAEVLGTSEATVSRLGSGKALAPDSKQGELALLFLRLFRSLDALVGGDESRARLWLHAENTHLGGVPADLIRRVEGLVDVVQYLDGMRGGSEIRPLEVEPYRVVEAQHQVSTRKLVDTDEEQYLLEQLIESAKPLRREHEPLHYLLFTPFRYPPLRHGSRFGTRAQPGIWYGSESLHTAFAEVAYYRLLFLEGTTAGLGLLETSLTSFAAVVRTTRGVDLTAPPFDAYEARLAQRSSYVETQSLGRELRAASVEVARYRSARDTEGGVNVAVFRPVAFGRRQPRRLATWHCVASTANVQVTRRDYFQREVHTYPREQFLVAGALPAPAL